MAVSRTTAWIAGGLLARLLAMAVLLLSVRFMLANNTYLNYWKLESYTYVVASGVVGLAGSLLQIPAAIYLLCKSSRVMPSVMILDISMYADIVMSLVLASGVGAGFGASNDALRYIRASHWESGQSSQRSDLIDYCNRGIVAVVFLVVGMLLCVCATVVSARLRARASNDHAAAV